MLLELTSSAMRPSSFGSLRLMRSWTVRLSFRKPLRSSSAGQLVDRAQAAVAQVVDVVDVPFAATQLEHVLQRVDEVLAAEGHHRLGHVLVELAVDAEAADAAEAVAVLVEELFLEERLRPSRAAAGCPDGGGRRSASARPRGWSAVSSASVLRISGSATLVTTSTRLEAADAWILFSASPICAPALTSSSPVSASMIGPAA